MRAWSLILAGLVVWAAHFFLLYAIASMLPGRPAIAAGLVALATALAVAAAGLVLWRVRTGLACGDESDRWVAYLATLGAAISLLGITWQAIPALFA